jgi:tetratricopeptide (TPR) repeat protein
MKNRLSPAFSRHLKPAPQPVTGPPIPRTPNAHDLLKMAAVHREKGQFREAEQLCLRVLTSSPRNPRALYLAGMLAFDADDADLAVQYLERAIKENPKDPYFHLALAEAHEKVSEFEPAIRHFHRALTLKPGLVGGFAVWGSPTSKPAGPSLLCRISKKRSKSTATLKQSESLMQTR